jgi:hypothetical protein
VVQGQPRQIVRETPISKITRANGLEVWLKCLLCKCEALSSNPQKEKRGHTTQCFGLHLAQQKSSRHFCVSEHSVPPCDSQA